jgi:hypothetical protein
MSINKLIVLGAAFILASLIGSTPAAAQTTVDPCDPAYSDDLILDCDGDTVPNALDQCPFYNDLDPTLNLADCDDDGVLNADDLCPFTVVPATFDLWNTTCNISGLDTIFLSGEFIGCSLAEVLEESLDACDALPLRNHGKFVSCVAKATNMLKKHKVISGAQKGQIQSCAAQTDIGKKPPKP